ncbi:MAG: hypothetical protein S0880_21350 [Actinomycetota bacterium]|nr:hypothetical protein [Actinomycetota bacterium]
MSTVVRVDLPEWSTTQAVVAAPTAGDLALAARLAEDAGGKLDLTWLHDGRLQVRSTSWVGTVRLSGATIRVVPKYVGEELGVLRMLEYSSGMRRLRRLPLERRLDASGAHLVDLIRRLFVEEVETLVLRGLINDYSEEEEALPVLRGSLKVREQVTRRFARLDALECRFDEFHGDVVANQLVAAGLSVARRLTTSAAIERSVRHLEAMVAEVCHAPTLDAGWYRERLVDNRRTEPYRAAHELALVLLDHAGLTDLYAERQLTSFAFLFDMNEIFEDFVTTLVGDGFAGTGWTVAAQRRARGVIVDERTGRSYATLIPDLVLDGPDGRSIPADVKYKRYDTAKLSSGDIYQTFVYSYALTAADADPLALLIYPSERSAARPQLAIDTPHGRTARIVGLGLPVPAVLDALSTGGAEKAEMLAGLRSQLLGLPGGAARGAG